jgi:hypothetical protein
LPCTIHYEAGQPCLASGLAIAGAHSTRGENMTKEQVDQLKPIDRDFMMVLRPVMDTREAKAALRITGIPFGMIYNAISTHHGCNIDQVRKLADNLRSKNYLTEDKFGFFVPTGTGEELIKSLAADYS